MSKCYDKGNLMKQRFSGLSASIAPSKEQTVLVISLMIFSAGTFFATTAMASGIQLSSTSLISDANLVAYYQLENASGTDNSGNGHSCTVNNSPTFSAGKFGSAVGLANNNEYLECGTSSAILDGSTSVGINAWVNATSVTGGTGINIIYDEGINKVGLYYNSSSLQYAYNGLTANINTGVPLNGQWHMVTVTHDHTSLLATFWVDGLVVGTTSSIPNFTGSYPNRIGIYGNAISIYGFHGQIDDLALFNRALTQTDISTLWGGDPTSFYAQIKNTGNGRVLLRSTPASTTTNFIKRLPQDWIVYVSSTVSATGSPIIADGYRWYDVIDPTDGVEGWMAASSSGAVYLSYSTSSTQSYLAGIATTTVVTSTRASLVSSTIDYYYNNTSTAKSLYSSNDSTSTISLLKSKNFPETVILGIAAWEDGDVNHQFSNETIAYDYGHGVMQITPYPLFYDEPTSTGNPWNYAANAAMPSDGSWLQIYPCATQATTTYVNCYTHSGVQDPNNTKPYKDNGHAKVSTT